MLSYYAGIGSRNTPPEILHLMKESAKILCDQGYTLRSGGARGADQAFESAVWRKDMKEIYKPNNEIQGWAFELAQKYLLWGSLDKLDPFVQKLLARNMMIMLGSVGNSPVKFVICWSKTLNIYDKEAGGTGYALRLAKDRNIPIYNLRDTKVRNKFEERILEYGNTEIPDRERNIHCSR